MRVEAITKPMIVKGNPADGFEYIGPFDSPSDAINWATDNLSEEWWTADLFTPVMEDVPE